MGIPGSANPMLFGGAAAYQINQSLRFDAGTNAYLQNASLGIYGNTNTTISFWLKHSTKQNGNIFACGANPSLWSLEIGPSSSGGGRWLNNGGTINIFPDGAGKLRDPAAWYHIVLRQTGNQSTIFLNGVQTNNNNSNSAGTNTGWYIGNEDGAGNNQLDGYLAEFIHVDGTAYDPSYFGEFDSITGAWIPKEISGITYGTKGFYLKFDPSATNGIGHDHSGNGNNFTATGFSTSGFESDCMVDTPTSNHPTINPVGNTAGNVFTQGNLEIADASSGGSWQGCQATIPFPTTGKWYYEMRIGGGTSNIFFGISSDAGRYASIMHDHPDTFAIRQSDCDPRPTGATTTGTKSGYGYNDIAGIAVNCDTGVIQFYKNGSLNVTFVTTFDPTKTYFASFMSSALGTQTMYFNFGAQGFAYTPPTGYKALNTANLPEPTIKKGSKYFDTKLFTAGTTTVTGYGFQPDLVWVKNRNQAYNHRLIDAVRGVKNDLYSNSTSAEQTNQSDSLLTFTSDGFTHGSFGSGSGDAFVGWAWDANGAGSSNTAGTITSTVSANASAGFSIVTYTGIAGDNISATVGHGLGVAPNLIIIKNRDWASSAAAWQTYHSSIPSTGTSPVRLSQSLSLDTTDAASGNDFKDQMNNTLPTSTVFSVSSHDGVSAANRYRTYGRADKYVAYCFSEVAGYSKFGSYTGNGSSDGPFVFCGFRPAFVMVKVTNEVTTSWMMRDSKRDPDNPNSAYLFPNSSSQEFTNLDFDFLSNGFKPRNTSNVENASGKNYIFAAFAELPFKYSNAR